MQTCEAGFVPWYVNGELIECLTVADNTTVVCLMMAGAVFLGSIVTALVLR